MSTPSELRFDGRTVVVTGAGAGLGRSYALFFASRGANVVVNDLGGSYRGEGRGSTAADKVVEEIKSCGGQAVANYDDVLNGERIIDTAIQHFGRVDVLINNAGILRDISFKNMKDDDWDLIMNVHVIGAYRCIEAAFPHFRKQRYGRIINTASAAGLFGSFGQCNYSAAKLSQIGFTESLAKEGQDFDIMCNVIAPIAASRLTATVLTPEVLDNLKPEFIVPLVAVLSHETNHSETGGIFEVGAGHMAKFRWERSKGAAWETSKSVTAGDLLKQWNLIGGFENPSHPSAGVTADELQIQIRLAHDAGAPHANLSNKVALIIGGARGLGRVFAIQLAKHGARIIVQDNIEPSDTIAEINRNGGQALGVKTQDTTGEEVVKAAINAYGSVHILVNSTKLPQSQFVQHATRSEFEQVLTSNLRSTFKTTKTVWPYFLKQKFGRIFNITSPYGIYGQPGQTSYATASSGILGFSRALALEGKKYNILVNSIAPPASSIQDAGRAGPVAQLAVLLCSDLLPEPVTGRLFESAHHWLGETRWQRSGGHGFPIDNAISPESVIEKWQQVTVFDDGRADNPSDQITGQSKVMANMKTRQSQVRVSPGSGKVDYPSIIKTVMTAKSITTEFTYNDRDVILYNLGIGAKRTDLPLVFEGHKDFQVLPTFGVIPSFKAKRHYALGDLVPNFHPMKVLHGEQYLEIRSFPIPTEATLVCVPRLVEVIDKGKASAITSGTTVKDKHTGRELFYTEELAFVRDSGNFGGKKKGSDRGAATRAYSIPKRLADRVVESKTTEDQAALYRLSGDRNPLHLDPSSSKAGGFDVPILHGLCFFGIAARAVWETYGIFRNIKVRFAGTVLPGQTIITEMWKDGNVVVFQAKVKETGKLCISGAGAELLDSSSKL